MSTGFYPRRNLFSLLAGATSDGTTSGYSETLFGLGNDVIVSLDSDTTTQVRMQQRPVDDLSPWVNIGAVAKSTTVYRMYLLADMKYRFQLIQPGSQAAAVTVRRAEPTSQVNKTDFNLLDVYSDGFPGNNAGAPSTSTDPREFISLWSLVFAQDDLYDVGAFVLGSDGAVYQLNDDRGGGTPGDPTVDPTSTQGTSSASWVKISNTDNNQTFVLADTVTAPATGVLPSSMPTGTDAQLNDLHVRRFVDYQVMYISSGTAWSELYRFAVGSGNPSSSGQIVFTAAAFDKPECPTVEEAVVAFAAASAQPGDGAVYTTPKGATNSPKIIYKFEYSTNGNVRMYGPTIPVYRHPNVLTLSELIDDHVWAQVNAAGNRTTWIYTTAGGIEPYEVYPSPDLSAIDGASQGLDFPYVQSNNITVLPGDTVTGGNKKSYKFSPVAHPDVATIAERNALSPGHGDTVTVTDPDPDEQYRWDETLTTPGWVVWNGTDPISADLSIDPVSGTSGSWVEAVDVFKAFEGATLTASDFARTEFPLASEAETAMAAMATGTKVKYETPKSVADGTRIKVIHQFEKLRTGIIHTPPETAEYSVQLQDAEVRTGSVWNYNNNGNIEYWLCTADDPEVVTVQTGGVLQDVQGTVDAAIRDRIAILKWSTLTDTEKLALTSGQQVYDDANKIYSRLNTTARTDRGTVADTAARDALSTPKHGDYVRVTADSGFVHFYTTYTYGRWVTTTSTTAPFIAVDKLASPVQGSSSWYGHTDATEGAVSTVIAQLKQFATVTALLSDTAPPPTYSTGQQITTIAERIEYVVDAPGSSTHDVVTDGGTKLKAVPKNSEFNVLAFGKYGAGITDHTAMLLKAAAKTLPIVVPIGNFTSSANLLPQSHWLGDNAGAGSSTSPTGINAASSSSEIIFTGTGTAVETRHDFKRIAIRSAANGQSGLRCTSSSGQSVEAVRLLDFDGVSLELGTQSTSWGVYFLDVNRVSIFNVTRVGTIGVQVVGGGATNSNANILRNIFMDGAFSEGVVIHGHNNKFYGGALQLRRSLVESLGGTMICSVRIMGTGNTWDSPYFEVTVPLPDRQVKFGPVSRGNSLRDVYALTWGGASAIEDLGISNAVDVAPNGKNYPGPIGAPTSYDNLIPNPRFYSATPTTLPYGWNIGLSGGGITAVVDTTVRRGKGESMKVTIDETGRHHLRCTIMDEGSAGFDGIKPLEPNLFRGQTVTFGVWCLSSVAGLGALQVKMISVVEPTAGGGVAAHSGSGEWEFLSFVYQIPIDATQLALELRNAIPNGFGPAGTFWFSEPVIMLGRELSKYSPTAFADTAGAAMMGPLSWNPQETLPVDSATPSVASGNYFKEASTVAVTVTDFLNGRNGQEIKIEPTTANMTIANNASIITSTGAAKLLVVGKIYEFIYNGTRWKEVDGPARQFTSTTVLLADTAPPAAFIEGESITTQVEGFIYKVAATGASDHHVTTAGGTKLYVVPVNRGYDIRSFGARVDATLTYDSTSAVQKAIDVATADKVKDVYAPGGPYLITSLNVTCKIVGTINNRFGTDYTFNSAVGEDVYAITLSDVFADLERVTLRLTGAGNGIWAKRVSTNEPLKTVSVITTFTLITGSGSIGVMYGTDAEPGEQAITATFSHVVSRNFDICHYMGYYSNSNTYNQLYAMNTNNAGNPSTAGYKVNGRGGLFNSCNSESNILAHLDEGTTAEENAYNNFWAEGEPGGYINMLGIGGVMNQPYGEAGTSIPINKSASATVNKNKAGVGVSSFSRQGANLVRNAGFASGIGGLNWGSFVTPSGNKLGGHNSLTVRNTGAATTITADHLMDYIDLNLHPWLRGKTLTYSCWGKAETGVSMSIRAIIRNAGASSVQLATSEIFPADGTHELRRIMINIPLLEADARYIVFRIYCSGVTSATPSVGGEIAMPMVFLGNKLDDVAAKPITDGANTIYGDLTFVGGLPILGELSTYADDAAAGVGGLTAGMPYKTAAHALMVKS